MTITRQRITTDVRINGTLISNVVSISTSAGFDQINLTATVTCAELPDVQEGDTLEIWASNGTQQGHIFSGEVTKVERSYAATKGVIHGTDLLARTRYEWGGEDQEEVEIDSAALVRHYLEIMGIPSSQASIEGSGDWELGVIDPVTLKNGDVPYSTIEQIDYFEGYRTFSLPTGVIVRRRVSVVTGASVAMTFEKGVQILADATWERGIEEIRNKVVIEGNEYEGLEISSENIGDVAAANGFIPNPPGFVTLREQTPLIEDDQLAFDFATRMLIDKNRRPEAIRFRVPFDPRPQPGMLIKVVHEDLVGGDAKGLLKNVGHDISNNGAFTTIDMIGGSLSLPQNREPIAVFDYQLFKESEDDGVSVTSFYMGFCDGTLSYDPDGEIASYAWAVSATGGSVTPTTGAAATFAFHLAGAVTEIVLSLTVTDDEGLTNTLERTIPIVEARTLVENKYLAWGTASVSVDGEKTWIDESPASGSATCLMPIAPLWGQVWGTSTGHIYATFDNLTTPLVDLGQPHGAVACTAVWVHETDQTRLWAGFSDGQVWFGLINTEAHTAVFSHPGNIAEGPVREIRESYGLFGELRATAGTSYYYSNNGGVTWVAQHTFDTAWRMAAGFDTNLASGLNDPAPIYDEDGTPPTVPSGVEHIRGLSFGWRDQELYAADDAAGLYLSTDPATFDLLLHADTTTAIVNHMIRSGNERRSVYMACGDGTGDNGFVKWIPDTLAPLYFRMTGTDAGLMVGYGAAHLPPINVDLLMVRGNVAGTHNIWHYSHITGAWSFIDGDLPAGKAWAGIVAHPLDPLNEWIIWNDTGDEAYYTSNGGTNWTQISGLATFADTLDPSLGTHVRHFEQFEFNPFILHEWAMAGWIRSAEAAQTTAVVATGNAASVVGDAGWKVDKISDTNGPTGRPESLTWTNDTHFVVYTSTYPLGNGPPPAGAAWLVFTAADVSGEYYGSEQYGGSGTYFAPYSPQPSRLIDALETGLVASVATADFSAGSEIWVAGQVYASQSSAVPVAPIGTPIGDDDTGSVAVTPLAVFAAGSDGIWQFPMTDLGGGQTVVVEAGALVSHIRADHTQRTAVVGVVKPAGTVARLQLYDGASWVSILPPSGTVALQDWVEVLAIV